MRLKPVEKQVVVVMGASSGIGRATALCFARRGASVVVSARSAAGLASLVAEIHRLGAKALAVVADVAHPEQVKHVAERAVAEYGRIDTWAHVAGVGLWATFEDTTPAEWKRLLEVNLLGQVHGAQAALPHLRHEGGALIHVSSVEAKVALPFSSAYAASKHGVAAFVDALRIELCREGVPVSVTQIMPAGIDTPLFANALTRLGIEPRPVAPVYAPELVAKAIVYAAEHPVRALTVGGAGVATLLAERLSPRFVDAMLLGRIGFEAQLTHKPKAADAPNNLFNPIAAEDQVNGDLGKEATSRSPATALQETAVARLAARVSGALSRLGARAVNALYALRFKHSIGGGKRDVAHEGGGLPAPVAVSHRHEAEHRGAAKHGGKKHHAETSKRRTRAPR